MAKINLLPWRAELRKERQKEFGIMLGLAAVFALVVLGMIHIYNAQLIDMQKGRNKYLEGEIAKLDKKIQELDQLGAEKQRLLDKMQAIEQLQSNRSLEVLLFDEVVATIPDGVSLQTFTQKGNAITVNGVAQSNARVSSYMRNIENSKVLKNPKLDVIQSKDQQGHNISTFTLHFDQIIPTTEGGGGS